jgi:hypothetical protein
MKFDVETLIEGFEDLDGGYWFSHPWFVHSHKKYSIAVNITTGKWSILQNMDQLASGHEENEDWVISSVLDEMEKLGL